MTFLNPFNGRSTGTLSADDMTFPNPFNGRSTNTTSGGGGGGSANLDFSQPSNSMYIGVV